MTQTKLTDLAPKKQLLCVYPDRTLRQTCKKVENFDEVLIKKITLLRGIMHICKGVGIAAPQCFLNDTLFIAHVGGETITFVNPEFTYKSDDLFSMEEGCLSVLDCTGHVPRSAAVGIKYQDQDGVWHQQSYEDHDAAILQHEMDHLEGKLIVDHASRLKRDIIKRRAIKLKKRNGLS